MTHTRAGSCPAVREVAPRCCFVREERGAPSRVDSRPAGTSHEASTSRTVHQAHSADCWRHLHDALQRRRIAARIHGNGSGATAWLPPGWFAYGAEHVYKNPPGLR